MYPWYRYPPTPSPPAVVLYIWSCIHDYEASQSPLGPRSMDFNWNWRPRWHNFQSYTRLQSRFYVEKLSQKSTFVLCHKICICGRNLLIQRSNRSTCETKVKKWTKEKTFHIGGYLRLQVQLASEPYARPPDSLLKWPDAPIVSAQWDHLIF